MPVMERTVDAELAALGKMFEEHRDRLLALVKQRMDPALAARLDPTDVLAKAFLRARGRCAQFSESGMPAYNWLCQVVLDTLFDEYDFHASQRRDYHKEVAYPDGSSSQFEKGLVHPGTDPSTAAAHKEMKERLAVPLECLKPADRDILRMLYTEHRPLQEVAALLDIPQGTARQRHARALRRLKKFWKKLYGSEGLQE
jgi:RNA polymerase sigma-70 factor (ECF subfamily)